MQPRLLSAYVMAFTWRHLHVHAEAVDEVPIWQRSGIQDASISLITLNAIPDLDVGLRLAHGAVVREFALVDRAVGVVLLLHGAKLFSIPSTTDAMSFLELCTLVILELLEQLFFSLAKSFLAGRIASDDVKSCGINSPYIR